MLYELLTGKRAFQEETITETIAAVLKSEPNWNALPATTPWRKEEVVAKRREDPPDKALDRGQLPLQSVSSLFRSRVLPITTRVSLAASFVETSGLKAISPFACLIATTTTP